MYVWVNNCWGHGNADQFVNNTCIANSHNGGFGSDCDKGPMMVVHGNAVYNEAGNLGNMTLCDQSNHVAGTWPSADAVVQMGHTVLGFPEK